MPKVKRRIGETAMQRDIRCGYTNVSFDADAAIRDPLFWLSMAVDKITFGLIDTGRWRRYIQISHAPQVGR